MWIKFKFRWFFLARACSGCLRGELHGMMPYFHVEVVKLKEINPNATVLWSYLHRYLSTTGPQSFRRACGSLHPYPETT